MLPNFGALEYKLEQSLLLMEKIVVELREIKAILKENAQFRTSQNIAEKI